MSKFRGECPSNGCVDSFYLKNEETWWGLCPNSEVNAFGRVLLIRFIWKMKKHDGVHVQINSQSLCVLPCAGLGPVGTWTRNEASLAVKIPRNDSPEATCVFSSVQFGPISKPDRWKWNFQKKIDFDCKMQLLWWKIKKTSHSLLHNVVEKFPLQFGKHPHFIGQNSSVWHSGRICAGLGDSDVEREIQAQSRNRRAIFRWRKKRENLTHTKTWTEIPHQWFHQTYSSRTRLSVFAR